MLAEGKEGLVVLGARSPAELTFGRTSGLRTSSVHGDFYDSNSRGNIFRACSATAGIAPGTALATTAQALVIYNPVDSGVNVNILRLAHAFVADIYGLGIWVIANYSVLSPNTNIAPGGTSLVVSRADGGVQAGKALAWSAATCTAAPILAEALDWEGVLDGTGATQVGSSRIFDFNGTLVQKPGTGCVMTFIGGGGTTPLVCVSAKWEEIPIA